MPDTPITPKQYAQIAAGLARRDDTGRPLRASDMQFNIVVVGELDASGRFEAPVEELLPKLRPCQRGKSTERRASRRTYAGTSGGSRKRVEQHRLFKCSRSYTDEHAPNGALKVTPWAMEPLATGDGDDMPAWSGFPEWGSRVRSDRELIAPELVAAFRLSISPAFAATGRLYGTRKELGKELCVEARTAMRLLEALDRRGHISLREEPVLETRAGRGRRARLWSVTAQTTTVLPSTAEIAAVPTDDEEDPDAPFEEPVAPAPEPEPEQEPVASASPAPTVVEPVRLRLTRAQYSANWVSALRALCTQPEHAGSAPVLLACPDGNVRSLRTGRGGEPITVTPGEALDAAIKALPTPARAPVPGRAPRAPVPAVAAHDAEIAALSEAAAKSPKKKRATKAEAAALRAQLWEPQLVDKAIAQAGRHHKGGAETFTPATLAAHFYAPVLALQEQYPAPFVKDALRQTVKKHIADNERYQTWTHYVTAICKRKGQVIGMTAPKPGTPAAAEAATNGAGRAACDLLERASIENSRGDVVAAHAILEELLAMTGKLAPLFDGSEEKAEYQVRLAFKQGGSDLHARRSRYGLDFYPEWSAETPKEGTRADEPEPAHAPPPEETPAASPTPLRTIRIRLTPRQRREPVTMRDLRATVAAHPGATPVVLALTGQNAVGERVELGDTPLTSEEGGTEHMTVRGTPAFEAAIKAWRERARSRAERRDAEPEDDADDENESEEVEE